MFLPHSVLSQHIYLCLLNGNKCCNDHSFFQNAASCPGTHILTLKWFSTLLSVYLGVCRKISRFCRKQHATAGSQGRHDGGRVNCSTAVGELPGGCINWRKKSLSLVRYRSTSIPEACKFQSRNKELDWKKGEYFRDQPNLGHTITSTSAGVSLQFRTSMTVMISRVASSKRLRRTFTSSSVISGPQRAKEGLW